MNQATEKLAYLASATVSAVTGFAWPALDPFDVSARILRAMGVEIGLAAFVAGILFAVAGRRKAIIREEMQTELSAERFVQDVASGKRPMGGE